MTDERRAELLARWLEESASGPAEAPEGLDPEVVEAVLALRPDLAPPPTLTADEILASVTAGPLAEPDAGEALSDAPVASAAGESEPAAKVVAFPTGGGDRRGWRLNRWGGLGVAVATAATLLVVAIPVLQSAYPEAAAPAAQELAVDPSPPQRQVTMEREAHKPAPPTADATPPAAVRRASEAKPLAKAAPRPAPPPAAPPPPEPAPLVPEPEPVTSGADLDAVALAEELASEAEMDASFREPALAEPQGGAWIPELEAAAAAPAAGGGAVPTEGFASEGARRVVAAEAEEAPFAQEAPRARPAPKEEKRAGRAPVRGGRDTRSAPAAAPEEAPAPNAGQDGRITAPRPRASDDGLRPVDQAIQMAEATARAGQPGEAAASLEPWIQPPAQTGQAVAVLAARFYLEAGDPEGAERVARKGLALSEERTTARRALLESLGRALHQQGDGSGAAKAWREAREGWTQPRP